jgi:hypothetical protein
MGMYWQFQDEEWHRRARLGRVRCVTEARPNACEPVDAEKEGQSNCVGGGSDGVSLNERPILGLHGRAGAIWDGETFVGGAGPLD